MTFSEVGNATFCSKYNYKDILELSISADIVIRSHLNQLSHNARCFFFNTSLFF